MKKYSIPFTGIDHAHNFAQLAKETRGQLENNNTIRWPGGIVRGQVKKCHLDAGLHMRVWDLHFSEPVELRKQALPLYVTNNSFSLLCVLTPGSVVLENANQHQLVNKVRNRTMLLVPDSVSVGVQITAYTPVRLIDFQIASHWLKSLPGYLHVWKYFNESVGECNNLPVLMEPLTNSDYHTAHKLFSGAIAGNEHLPGELLKRSGLLITAFLEKIAAGTMGPTSGNVTMYYEKILEVEAILMKNLQGNLPRLGNIALQVALSESTLKRYFKQIFGKSIYEYYLVKKMEMARKLMIEQPLTVNEAAELMGYEKASNFIDIFKKHHGCSPGAIRKKGTAIQDENSGTIMCFSEGNG